MTDFTQQFAASDAVIIAALGDAITFKPPFNAYIYTHCVLSARPGSGSKDVYSWTDDLWAKIDIYSTIIEMPEAEAPGIAKGWVALFNGVEYLVSEVYRKGDGTIAVVLNQPGNTTATASGWK
jgi:hypothetical protein